MLVLLPFLVLTPLLPRGDADAPACPNVRACDVGVAFDEVGTPRRCGVGVSLLGFDISLGGEKCWPRRITTPAHQECHGKPNVGTWCAFERVLDVIEERCECSRLGLLGTGIALPECECTTVGNAGTVQDYQTRNCEPDPSGGGGHGGSR